MEIKIESCIPIPSVKGGTQGFTEVVRALKVEESFAYPKARRTSVTSAIRTARIEDNSKKFITREVAPGTLRIWRVK